MTTTALELVSTGIAYSLAWLCLVAGTALLIQQIVFTVRTAVSLRRKSVPLKLVARNDTKSKPNLSEISEAG